MEHLDHPSPHFNDAKMARFLLLRAFIIALGGGGGWGIIVPFYTVQDCSFLDLESEIERVLQETNNSARKSKTLFVLKLNIIIFPLYNINERFRCTS